jgi:hypothetical protein
VLVITGDKGQSKLDISIGTQVKIGLARVCLQYQKERKKKEESKSFVVVDDDVLIFLETYYVSFQKMSSSLATMSTGVSSKLVIYQEN